MLVGMLLDVAAAPLSGVLEGGLGQLDNHNTELDWPHWAYQTPSWEGGGFVADLRNKQDRSGHASGLASSRDS